MTHDLHGTYIGHGCSLVARLRRTVVPMAPVMAGKCTHPRFAINASNAGIWPLSPKDWSSG